CATSGASTWPPSPHTLGASRRSRGGPRLPAGLELHEVAVGVAKIEGGAGAERAAALDDVALQRHPALAQRGGELVEVVAADGQADVVHASRGGPRRVGGGRQQGCGGLGGAPVAGRDAL